MSNIKNRIMWILYMLKIKCDTKIRGEGHLIAVMMVMAVVCACCVYFREQIADWFADIFVDYKNETSTIFSNM